jgi:hypothetical protein
MVVRPKGQGGFKDETIGHREGFWQPRNQRDFMYFDEVLWQNKMRIQNKRWYQKERNKEINILKKESKSLSRILGDMKQELDVLTQSRPIKLQKER